MKVLTSITDPVYIEPQKFRWYEKFWLKYINDKRDLPFIHLLTAIHIVVIPVAVLLYTPFLQGWYWWVAYVPYFYLSQMYFKGRFGLMLHCIVHRKLFKKVHLAIPLGCLVCLPFFWPYTRNVFCASHGHAPRGE